MAKIAAIVLEVPENATTADVQALLNEDFATQLNNAISVHGNTALVAAQKKNISNPPGGGGSKAAV